MPVIRGTFGKLTKEMKSELIKKFTDAAVEVTKYPAESFVVLLEELENDSIGTGGKTIEELIKNSK